MTVNVTSALPFRTRVVASDVFVNQFEIVVVGSADLSMESSGITFTLACSDGVASDMAVVVLNVVPSIFDYPVFIPPLLNPVRILSSVQVGTTIAMYRASVSLH